VRGVRENREFTGRRESMTCVWCARTYVMRGGASRSPRGPGSLPVGCRRAPAARGGLQSGFRVERGPGRGARVVAREREAYNALHAGDGGSRQVAGEF
jgi:hypothetical protein